MLHGPFSEAATFANRVTFCLEPRADRFRMFQIMYIDIKTFQIDATMNIIREYSGELPFIV